VMRPSDSDKARLSLKQVLEYALVTNPDDLAAHMAYADHLTEQGDPRGEFIQVQLVLEDDHLSDGERERLRQRERELLDAQGRDWLGPLADFVLGQTAWSQEDMIRFEFARGWLHSLHIPTLTDGLSGALGRNPQARLLQQLTMVTTAPSVRVSRWEDSLLNSP